MPDIKFTRRTEYALENKVRAIKQYRTIKNDTLKDAKDAIEDMLASPDSVIVVTVDDITPNIYAALKDMESAGFLFSIDTNDPYATEAKNMEFLVRMIDNSIQNGRYYEAMLLIEPLSKLLNLNMDAKVTYDKD